MAEGVGRILVAVIRQCPVCFHKYVCHGTEPCPVCGEVPRGQSAQS